MIHAAITAVALSCCTTIALADDTGNASELKTIEFGGGSVSEYVDAISTIFEGRDAPSNIVLFPGTEYVELPPITFAVSSPGEALDVIADHVFTTANGMQVSISHETIGIESPVHRVSGHEYRPHPSRNRVAGQASNHEVGIALVSVPAGRMDTVLAITERAFALVGLDERSTLVPVPGQDLLLVTSTARGRDLVEEIVIKVIHARPFGDEEARSRREASPSPGVVTQSRRDRTRIVGASGDESSDGGFQPGFRPGFRLRFHELVREMRQMS